MKCTRNASLKTLNSFAVEAHTEQLLVLESEHDVQRFTSEHHFDAERDLILGGGSNILFAGDVKGTVVLNRLSGKRIVEDSGDEVLVEVSGGEDWHRLVLWSLEMGLCGLENLSLIPGLAGAAPMQNIGAYGVELSEVLDSVQAVEMNGGEISEFSNKECHFGYRDSRFKSADFGTCLITRIRLRLRRRFSPRLDYPGIIRELNLLGIGEPTAKQVSNAVIRIRQRKLPNPDTFGNAGSFFKNPVVSRSTAMLLAKEFGDLPVYHLDEHHDKLGAAWMIEHCGWKGHREGDAGVSDTHALVLLNYGNASGTEILGLAERIRLSIHDRFGIDLQPEPGIVK